MKTKEGGLTLRQRYEAQHQNERHSPSPSRADDAILRAMLGCEVAVKFQTGGEVTAVFTALDRFTIKLGSDLVVFKRAIQSMRLAEGDQQST